MRAYSKRGMATEAMDFMMKVTREFKLRAQAILHELVFMAFLR